MVKKGGEGGGLEKEERSTLTSTSHPSPSSSSPLPFPVKVAVNNFTGPLQYSFKVDTEIHLHLSQLVVPLVRAPL